MNQAIIKETSYSKIKDSIKKALEENLVPVVISNKVGISDVIKENNAGLVVNLDANSLCNGIKSFLASRELVEKLTRNARNLVYKIYDIDVVAVKMINAYQEILNGFKR